MSKEIEEKLNDVISILCSGYPKKERYPMKVTNSEGTRDYLAPREEYLDCLIDAAVNEIYEVLDTLGEMKTSKRDNIIQLNRK